jgi:hypothetical protein
MKRNKRFAVLAGSIGAIVLAVACGGSGGDSGPTGSTGGTTGAYVLQSVNGGSLPGTYRQTAAERLTLDSAVIRLSSNGAFSDLRVTTLYDFAGVHKVSDTKTGTWTESGGTVTFSFNNDLGIPSTATATLANGVMTKVESGVTLKFQKK